MSGSAWAVPGTEPTAAAIARAERAVMSRFRPLNTSGRSPLQVVRLPGELTGSGRLALHLLPGTRLCTALQAIHPRGFGSPAPWPRCGLGLGVAPARIRSIHSHGRLSATH